MQQAVVSDPCVGSFPRDEFVEVQQHARHRGPGGELAATSAATLRPACVRAVRRRSNSGLLPAQESLRAGSALAIARRRGPGTGGRRGRARSRRRRAPRCSDPRRQRPGRTRRTPASLSSVSACSGVFERMRRVQVRVGVGGVEDDQRRVRGGAPEVRVHAAAVAVRRRSLAFQLLSICVKLIDAVGLRREDARAADLRRQQAAGGQGRRRGRSRRPAAAAICRASSRLRGVDASPGPAGPATTADRSPR